MPPFRDQQGTAKILSFTVDRIRESDLDLLLQV
jgi:hypothetical protein